MPKIIIPSVMQHETPSKKTQISVSDFSKILQKTIGIIEVMTMTEKLKFGLRQVISPCFSSL